MGTFKQKLRSLMIVLLLLASVRSFAGSPTWTRVDYTRSTTFVGVVKIKQFTSAYPYTPVEGDYIGAFVNGQCRMIAQTFTYSGDLYVSSVIQGSDTCLTSEPNCVGSGPEEVEFRLWSNATNTEYGADVATQIKGTIMTAPDGNIGSTNAYEIGKPNSESKLSILSIAGVLLSPSYTSATTSYKADVNTVPVLADYTTKISSRATVSIETVNSVATIIVTAEDGVAKSTYTITYTTKPTCPLTGTTPIASATKLTICPGEQSILSAKGVDGVGTMKWYEDQAKTKALSSTTVKPVATTTYYVAQDSSVTCVSSLASITLTVNDAPTVVASADPAVFCQGKQTTISASGADSYVWDTIILSGASTNISPEKSAIFKVTGTKNGCSATATASVTVNKLPATNVTATPSAVCDGGKSTLLASGGANYKWSNSNVTVASQEVVLKTETTYTVTAISSEGCESSKSVTVVVSAKPSILVTPTITVCQDSAVPFVASGAETIKIFDGLTEVQISDMAKKTGTTTYTVVGTSAGCTDSATSTVTINKKPVLNLTATPAAVCTGKQTTIVADGGAKAYVFDNSVVNNVAFVPTATKTYTVTATSNEGCQNIKSVVVTVNDAPVAPTVADSTACSNASKSYTLTASGLPNASFTWYEGATQVGTSKTLVVDHAGTFSVIQTLGCASPADTAILTVKPSPEKPVCQSVTACDNDPLSKKIPTAKSYETAPTFVWYSGSDMKTQIATGVQPSYDAIKSYPVVFVSQIVNGCESNAAQQVTLTYNTHPTVSIGNVTSPICLEASAITLEGTPAGGKFFGDGVVANTFTPATATSGSHTITYIYTDGSTNCSDTAKTDIVVNQIAAPKVQQPAAVLLNGEMPTIVAEGSNIVWLDSTKKQVATGLTFKPTYATDKKATHSFYVKSVDGNCMSSEVLVTVSVTDCPTASPVVAVKEQSACKGVQFSAFSATKLATASQIKWENISDNNTVSTVETFTPTVAGTYSVKQFDNNCWSAATIVTAIVNELPVVSITPIEAYCSNEKEAKQLIASPSGGTFKGNGVSNTSFVATNNLSEEIVYTYTDKNSCTATDTIKVTLYPAPVKPVITDISPVCEPATFTLSQTGGTNVKWFDDNKVEVSSNVSKIAAGTYKYYAIETTVNNCKDTASISVVVKSTPVPPTADALISYEIGSTINSVSVVGTNVAVTEGSKQLTVVDNKFTPTISTATEGTATYCATQTSTQGCVSECKNIVVTVVKPGKCPVPAPSISSISECEGTSIVIPSSNELRLVDPEGKLADFSIGILKPGSYQYRAYATNGTCNSDTTLVPIVVKAKPAIPVITNTNTNVTVDGKLTPITATGTGLSWLVNDVAATDPNTVINTSKEATFVISVKSVENSCESSVATTSVVVKAANCNVEAPSVNSVTVCKNATATLSAVGSNIVWYSESKQQVGTGNEYTTKSVGTYFATQTVGNCTSSETEATVANFTATPVDITEVGTLCSTANPVLLSATPVGGSFTVNGVASTSFDPTKATIGLNKIIYSTTDGNNCSISDSIVGIVNATPSNPTITTAKNLYYVGETVQDISATNEYALVWTVNGETVQNPNTAIKTDVPAEYEVSVKSVNGTCASAIAKTTIEVVTKLCTTPAPTVVKSIESVCSDSSATFTAVGATSVKWYNNSGVVVGNELSYTTNVAGKYTVTQTVGCESSADTVELIVINPPVITFKDVTNNAIYLGDFVLIETNPSNSTLKPIEGLVVSIVNKYTPTTQGIKIIEASIDGCSSTKELSVNIRLSQQPLKDSLSRANSLLTANGLNIGDLPGQYPQSAYDALTLAVSIAKNTLDTAKTQLSLDIRTAALGRSIKEFLNSIIKLDLTSVNSKISEAQELAKTSVVTPAGTPGSYPQSAKEAFDKAIINATNALALAKTQADVTQITTNLTADIANYKSKYVAIVAATSIKISGYSSFNYGVDESFVLSYTIMPANATSKNVRWSSSNSNVVYVDNTGSVLFLSKGNATITASIEGTSISDVVSFTVTDDAIVAEDGVKLYPSVASTHITIEGAVSAKIIGIGATVTESVSSVIELQVSDLASQTYYVQIVKKNGKTVTIPFVKQ